MREILAAGALLLGLMAVASAFGTPAPLGGVHPTGAPAAPTNFNALARSGHLYSMVLLNWTEPTGTVTMHSVRYVVGSGCAAWTTTKNITPVQTIVSGVDNRQYLLGGLAGTTTYCFQIAAWNGTAESSWSSSKVVATYPSLPPACNCTGTNGGPYNLAVTNQGTTNATLIWNNPTGTISNNTIYYGTGNCSVLPTRVSTSGPAVTWNLISLTAGQWYCVRVGAWYTSTGTQALSNSAGIYLGAPYALAVTGQNTTSVSLKWKNPSATIANVTVYYQAGSCVGNFTSWSSAGGNKTVFNVTKLNPSNQYCFGVTVWDSGQTQMSNLVLDTTDGSSGGSGGGGGGGNNIPPTTQGLPPAVQTATSPSGSCFFAAWEEIVGLVLIFLFLFMAIGKAEAGWIVGSAVGGGLVVVGYMQCGII